MKPSRYHVWTEKEKGIITRRHGEGCTDVQIRAALVAAGSTVTIGEVSSQRHRMGLRGNVSLRAHARHHKNRRGYTGAPVEDVPQERPRLLEVVCESGLKIKRYAPAPAAGSQLSREWGFV